MTYKPNREFEWLVKEALSRDLVPVAAPEELWTGRRCCRCKGYVMKELDESTDYPYYCPTCDEHMYRIETEEDIV